MKPSNREIIINSIVKGNEKKYTYDKKEGETEWYVNVNVIYKNSEYLISIRENMIDLESFYNDADEKNVLLKFTEISQLEDYLQKEIGITIDKLEPAKGMKFFPKDM